MSRISEIERRTKETEIFVRLNIDAQGCAKIQHPIGVFAHLLDNFAHHGLFDIEIKASGDLHVDQHHLVEDTGLVLGAAFSRALGERTGIKRAGSCTYPMDETLVRAAFDLSGRPFLVYESALSRIPVVAQDANGNTTMFQLDTLADFWQAFTNSLACALHLDTLRGRSDHHKAEALFKAAARALRTAVEIDSRAADRTPSTKGILDKGIVLC